MLIQVNADDRGIYDKHGTVAEARNDAQGNAKADPSAARKSDPEELCSGDWRLHPLQSQCRSRAYCIGHLPPIALGLLPQAEGVSPLGLFFASQAQTCCD